jgi:hypothetical protein
VGLELREEVLKASKGVLGLCVRAWAISDENADEIAVETGNIEGLLQLFLTGNSDEVLIIIKPFEMVLVDINIIQSGKTLLELIVGERGRVHPKTTKVVG